MGLETAKIELGDGDAFHYKDKAREHLVMAYEYLTESCQSNGGAEFNKNTRGRCLAHAITINDIISQL